MTTATAHVGAGAPIRPGRAKLDNSARNPGGQLMKVAPKTPAARLLMNTQNPVELRSTGRVGHPPLRGHCWDLRMNRGIN
jgi:hypothetical protein